MTDSRCAVIRELDSLDRVIRQNRNLDYSVIQGLDLRKVPLEWDNLSCRGSVFLGCVFPEHLSVCDFSARGALVFPAFPDLPYNPFRPELYCKEELMDGWSPERDHSFDRQVYEHYVEFGKKNPHVLEALAERVHDHAIDDALQDLLEGRIEKDGKKKVVAIMGGHCQGRDTEQYRSVAHLARKLTQEGFFIASGGGPGVMEAANLGAYLADEDSTQLEEVIEELSMYSDFRKVGYVEAGLRVLDRFPIGQGSLAVPTWFYGHEPTNLFATFIAKYFSNSIREDGLLAIARYGVIFAQGSGGTTQEIFQDACQNHYATLGEVSPMIFMGKQRYTVDTPLWETLNALSKDRHYQDLLFLSDEVDEIVSFIKSNPPIPSDGLKALVDKG